MTTGSTQVNRVSKFYLSRTTLKSAIVHDYYLQREGIAKPQSNRQLWIKRIQTGMLDSQLAYKRAISIL